MGSVSNLLEMAAQRPGRSNPGTSNLLVIHFVGGISKCHQRLGLAAAGNPGPPHGLSILLSSDLALNELVYLYLVCEF
jgi:hypothetical protein